MAVVLLFLRNLRAAVGPIAILLLATLFTVLPMAAFGQTINLLSLAGLAIAMGEMVDATIVIVENCSAELRARGTVTRERTQRSHRPLHRVGCPAVAVLAAHHPGLVPADLLPRRTRSAAV